MAAEKVAIEFTCDTCKETKFEVPITVGGFPDVPKRTLCRYCATHRDQDYSGRGGLY